MSITSQAISIAELEQAGPIGAVWVLNTAAKSEYRDYFPNGGEVRMTIPRINGEGSDPLLVRHTWLPINIAGGVGRPRLLNSMEFRSSVEKGLLTIIPEKLAREMLAQEGAAEEQERMRAFDAHVRQAGAPKKIDHAKVSIKIDNEDPDDSDDDEDEILNSRRQMKSINSSAVDVYTSQDLEDLNNGRSKKSRTSAGAASEDPEDQFKASFIMFVDKIKGEGDMQAMNAIRTRPGFTKSEYQHMSRELTRHPKTVKMIKARLDARKKEKRQAA